VNRGLTVLVSEKLVPVAQDHWMSVHGGHESSISGRLLAPAALTFGKVPLAAKFFARILSYLPRKSIETHTFYVGPSCSTGILGTYITRTPRCVPRAKAYKYKEF
jgi:hypothetical protein